MNHPPVTDIPALEKRITLENGRLLQVGALVYRPCASSIRSFNGSGEGRTDEVAYEILLVTSRGSGRWIIPKGWPMPGRTLAQAALREAYEEAGIRGRVSLASCGHYHYQKKDVPETENNRFRVVIFTVFYERQKKKWPEQGQRIFEWVAPLEAARRVEETGLKKILINCAVPGALPYFT